MECPLCGHAEVLVYGKTSNGDKQNICPACHGTFVANPSKKFTALKINLLNFRDRILTTTRSIPNKIAAMQFQDIPEIIEQERKTIAKPENQIIPTDVLLVFAFTAIQCIWMSVLTSLQVGLINILPTFMFLAMWYLFTKLEYKKYFWICFSVGFILTLRLPLTLSRGLEPFSWIVYIVLIGLVIYKIATYFQQNKKLLLVAIAALIVLHNSFAHVSLNSPYSYVFRVRDNLPSQYSSGTDNIKTFECRYEGKDMITSCDMGTYTDIERIFTDRDFNNASANFYLRRFFFSYLSSLIGYPNNRWIASFSINLLLWLFACASVYKICLLVNLGENVAVIAMLICASGWGFIHFVGQPGAYLASYAYSAIALWASIILIGTKDVYKTALMLLIILSGTIIYDVYPIALACAFLAIAYKRFVEAGVIVIGQIVLAFLWRNIFSENILGTSGTNITTSLITNSLETWKSIFLQLNFQQAFHYISHGTLSFVFAGFIFGTIASIFTIYKLATKYFKEDSQNRDTNNLTLLVIYTSLSVLILLSSIYLAPEVKLWTTYGLQPRFAYYTYPIDAIALSIIANTNFKKFSFVLPVVAFLIANMDITGLVSVALFFDFGFWGIYWR
jgi:hypothetical protein